MKQPYTTGNALKGTNPSIDQSIDIQSIRNLNKGEDLHSEIGIWLFVLGDMVLFGLLFISYAFDYTQNRELFEMGQSTLDGIFGVTNTLLLLTGSAFVVLAVNKARRNNKDNRKILLYLSITILTGIVFVVSKIIEYSIKISHGYTLVSNEFFMYYYTLTVIHLGHVFVGIGVLTFLWFKFYKKGVTQNNIEYLVSGGLIWHMVDLLWIALFPLLYLI